MTPQEIVRVIEGNILDTRKVMERGPDGYVLQFADQQTLLCESGGKVRQDNPLRPDVIVAGLGRASAVRSFWNAANPENQVLVKRRRDAYADYIASQEDTIKTVNTLLELEELNRSKRK